MMMNMSSKTSLGASTLTSKDVFRNNSSPHQHSLDKSPHPKQDPTSTTASRLINDSTMHSTTSSNGTSGDRLLADINATLGPMSAADAKDALRMFSHSLHSLNSMSLQTLSTAESQKALQQQQKLHGIAMSSSSSQHYNHDGRKKSRNKDDQKHSGQKSLVQDRFNVSSPRAAQSPMFGSIRRDLISGSSSAATRGTPISQHSSRHQRRFSSVTPAPAPPDMPPRDILVKPRRNKSFTIHSAGSRGGASNNNEAMSLEMLSESMQSLTFCRSDATTSHDSFGSFPGSHHVDSH
jgi:hypothetical protein